MLILYAGKLDIKRYNNIKKMYPNSTIKGLCYDFKEIDNKNYNKNIHILFDITNRHPVEDKSVDIYISEHVFEHIEYNKIPYILTDIYRILKENGKLIISLPDYKNQYLLDRINIFDANLLNTTKSKNANWPCQSSLFFNYNIINNKIVKIEQNDPVYKNINGKSINISDIKFNNNFKCKDNKILVDYLGGLPDKGGHIWFPTIDNVRLLFENSIFNQIIYYHYNNDDKDNTVINDMPYTFLTRLPSNDNRCNGQVISLVMECIK
jgi:hypothetical protein